MSKTKIASLLNSLGTCSSQIVKNLIEAKIKGNKKNPHTCPIAQYMKTALVLEDVAVTKLTIRVGYNLYPIPKQVARFIEEFDNGSYPVLDEIRGSGWELESS